MVDKTTKPESAEAKTQPCDRVDHGPRNVPRDTCMPVSTSPVLAGRSTSSLGQVFWLPDRPTRCAFPSIQSTVARSSGRPRLQRRDRNGFAPFSLFTRQSCVTGEYLSDDCTVIRDQPSVKSDDGTVVGQLNERFLDWAACSHAERRVSMILAVLEHGDPATAVTPCQPNIKLTHDRTQDPPERILT